MSSIKNKIGLTMTIIGGLGLAYILALVAYEYIANPSIAWGVVVSGLIAGVVFIAWATKDLRTHQKNPNKEHDKIYNSPNH